MIAADLAAELLEALHPLRPPAWTAQALAAEALAAAALGLALAALVAALRAPRSRRDDALAAARRLPPDARLAAILDALRAAARPAPGEDWAAALDRATRGRFSASAPLVAARSALYRPDAAVDADAAEAAARRLLRRLPR